MNHLKTRKFWIFVVLFLICFTGIAAFFYSSQHHNEDPNAPKGYSGIASPLNNNAKSAVSKIQREVAAAPQGSKTEMAAVGKINTFKDLKTLERKFHSKFQLDYSPSGLPFRLSGKLLLEKLEGETEATALSRLLSQVSPLLNIDNPGQLQKPQAQTASLGTITNFQQTYEDIPVEGAQVRVHQDSTGHVFMINSTYLPNVAGVNTSYQVTPEEAVRLATLHALSLDPQQRQPTVTPATKVVYQFKRAQGNIDSSWKILVNQPWLGVTHGSATYFINAHRADINDTSTFDRVENALQ